MNRRSRAKNISQNVMGKAKETIGNLTDNQRLESHGQNDQAIAKLKQAAQKVKDAFKK